ncbi:hypothetical protein Rhe02_48880 [Rhizocola hellebori]|uniref:SRPBCC domain-containing protein n=1 Tax=Rhizocola hellebori TaxID=1392758 RepID=A0A8J3VIA2_9ACTN|nr:SRPBCC domain-containing protein [Rhizocola hellebori]GIH06821.1 hypothetical protein Rhe02_48880 [Rhizocola hellebori]
MGHEFETVNDITVTATPEQVWQAIATGPGIDSWFMGRNEVEPGEGGKAVMEMEGMAMESTITAWEPNSHFAFRSAAGEDGTFHAFEYLVEGRDQGSTTVRLVHSGFLGQDDWEWEYDALRKGDPMYFATLREYLTHFLGRFATPVAAWAAPQPDEETAWAGVKRGLGITGEVTAGTPVKFTFAGQTVEGIVDSALYPSFLGVRTSDALYRFVGGQGMIGVGHHIFADVDAKQATDEWKSWLTNLFA